MIRFILFLALTATACAELIPARRLADWSHGTTTGVGVYGGIAQYRPGGANARTTLRNAVTEFSADNTGATNAAGAINTMIAALGTNEVGYLPPGVYLATAPITSGVKSNYTIRGGGQFTLSRSVNTIGTGTKTFQVAEGLGYTPGCGVWAWVWDRDQIAISSITRTGSTATITTRFPHGFATGSIVDTRGVDQTEYTGGRMVTVTGPTTYTVRVSGSPTSPATGKWMYAKMANRIAVTSVTHAANVVTVTTAEPHGFAANEIVYLVGADQPEYDLETTGGYATPRPITVTSTTTYTFPLTGSGTVTGTVYCGSGGNEGQGFGANVWLKGTCVSYSGGELVVDVDSAQGHSGVYAMWKVSVTLIDMSGASANLTLGSASLGSYLTSSANLGSVPGITGSPVRGATVLTVSDPGAWIKTTTKMAQISIKDNYDANSGHADDSAIVISGTRGYNQLLRQTVEVLSVVGDQVTLATPLLFDLPSSRSPKIMPFMSGTTIQHSLKVGIEDLAVFGHNSDVSGALVGMNQATDSWMYRVSVHSYKSGSNWFGSTLRNEMRECWASYRKIGGSNGTGVSGGSTSGLLLIDNVIAHGSPAVEMNGNCHYAFVGNYIYAGNLNTNHTAPGKFALVEGNLLQYLISDGYFASESEQMVLRNWLIGYNYYTAGTFQLRHARFTYNAGIIGNRFGTPGYIDGGLYIGLPNISNQGYNGTASARDGRYWAHLTATGPITGTLTTRTSNSAGIITLTSPLTAAVMEPPVRNEAVNGTFLWWGTLNQNTELRGVAATSSFSGSTFQVSGGSGANLPDAGTLINLWMGNGGYQEIDEDVEGTQIRKGNGMVTGDTITVDASLGGETLPNSYVFTAKPASYGDSLTWPLDPLSSDVSQGFAVIPASYHYFYGNMPTESATPDPDPEPSAGSATINTLNVTGSLNILE
jgi:hypothetical protein